MPRPAAVAALTASMLTAVLGLSATASAATPRPGLRYDGNGDAKTRAFVKVAKDGKRFSRYGFVTRTKCNDGRTRVQGLTSTGERPVKPTRSGSFAGSGKPGPFVHRLAGGKSVKGTARLNFQGRFTSRDHAEGTLTATFSSKTLNCSSGKIRFSVDRDGSRARPHRTKTTATGRYAVKGKRMTFEDFDVLAPAPSLSTRLRVRSTCGRYLLRSNFRLEEVPIEEARFVALEPQTLSLGNGLKTRETLKLRGRVLRKGGKYRVKGTLTLRSRVLRGGRTIDRCSSGNRAFSGTLVSGPARVVPAR